jgi:hypothetical protein
MQGRRVISVPEVAVLATTMVRSYRLIDGGSWMLHLPAFRQDGLAKAFELG